jgi:tetratricopeptide (TPR) repeat protein
MAHFDGGTALVYCHQKRMTADRDQLPGRPNATMSIRPIGASLLALSLSLTGTLVLAESSNRVSAEPPANSADTPAATSDQPISSDHAVTELTADVIYGVLVGEIAQQRGDQKMAFTHFLHAARLARDPGLAELAARSALALGDADSAVRATELWVELAPNSPKARQIGAYVQIDAGNRAGALAELRDLIRLAPDRGEGYMQAAQMLTRVSETDERLAMMRELVADDTEDADAQHALAMLAAAADDTESARLYAERAAQLRPEWNKPRVFLIRLLVSEERTDEAVALLERYLVEQPDDQELALMRAQFYMEAEEYQQALDLFDRMLAAGPGQSEVLFAGAVLALQIEALDRARTYLERLRDSGERADDTAFLLGQLEEQAGNSDLAMDWFGKVGGENLTSAQVRIAGLHADKGEVARAREIMQQLRDQSPGDPTTLYLIEGEMLRERGLDAEASQVYSAALETDPDNADLLYARAMLAVSMDRVDLLEQDLRRILIAEPDHVDALNALGYTLADRTDRLDEAHSLIQRALQLDPDQPAILDSMGWVTYRMGDAEAAEPYLRKALDAVFDAEIAAHLGEVLWSLGKKDEARAIWDRALAEDPEHEYLLRVLSRHRFSQTEH